MTTEHRPGLAETLTHLIADHSLVSDTHPHGVGMVDMKLPVALVAVVRAAQDVEVLLKRPDESYNDYCERRAELFHRNTGILAPGKDQPALGQSHSDVERQSAYQAWSQRIVSRHQAALAELDKLVDIGR